MRVGVYLTCQGKYFGAIRRFLPDHVQFFYEENWVMFQARARPTPEWRNLDYFIYQPIVDPVAEEYKDENILAEHVAPRAVRIRVPYLMFTGLTPWRVRNDEERLGTEHGNSWINALPDDDLRREEGLRSLLEWEGDELQVLVDKSLEQMREKEQASDLTGLTDWINERFREVPLFWTPNHPRGILAYEFCNRILRLIGLQALPSEAVAVLDRVLSVERTPIFPGVARRLGLRLFHNVAFRRYGRPMSVPEYVQAYARSLLEIRASRSE